MIENNIVKTNPANGSMKGTFKKVLSNKELFGFEIKEED